MEKEIDVQYKVDKKLFTPIKYTYQLKDFLYGMTKDELNEIRKTLDIKGISKLKKDELIESLEKFILENLQNIIKEKLDEEEVGFITNIINNKGVIVYDEDFIEYGVKFKNLGLAFLGTLEDEEKVVIIPQDMRETIGELVLNNKEKNESNENKKWIDIIKALLYYYGVMYIEDAHRITENLYDQRIDFYNYLVQAVSIENEIYEYNKERKILYLKEIINPFYILHEQSLRGIDYLPITKDMVDSVMNHQLTSVEKSFYEILTKKYNVQNEKAEETIKIYTSRIKNGYSFEQSVENMFTFMEFKNNKEMNDFINILANIYNNTPMWALKGYTPEELSNMKKPKGVTIVKGNKIGRNEPCPCGSGKKYKNCCGK